MIKFNSADYQHHVFPNGLRLIHRPQAGTISHLALLIHAGSRDEPEQFYGVAHLIEHMLFKGTNRRKAYHVISRMENVGSDINAYTTKEETCLHASFLPAYYGRSIELFSDVCFHSVFPEHELAKEKDVVLDEIHSYRDNPTEEIVDEFENQIFANHPLGHFILGTTTSIASLSRQDLIHFREKHYRPSQMVIASVGQIRFNDLIKEVEQHFGMVMENVSQHHRRPPQPSAPTQVILEKNNFLSHAIVGNIAYPYLHPKRIPMAVLNHVLGGPTLNSRLNMNIREKYGFTYSIDSQYNAYSDTGWFGLSFGTSPEHLEKVLKLALKELDRLRNEKLGIIQLTRAKQQIAVQMALAYESGMGEALGIARNQLFEEIVPPIAKLMEEVYAVSASDLLEVANEVFDPKRLSTLIYKSPAL
ncbi:MAG: insulinase family protein [Bacteroidales bacterium]|nr:insulinase family protein [Bacteroidales bacterium]